MCSRPWPPGPPVTSPCDPFCGLCDLWDSLTHEGIRGGRQTQRRPHSRARGFINSLEAGGVMPWPHLQGTQADSLCLAKRNVSGSVKAVALYPEDPSSLHFCQWPMTNYPRVRSEDIISCKQHEVCPDPKWCTFEVRLWEWQFTSYDHNGRVNLPLSSTPTPTESTESPTGTGNVPHHERFDSTPQLVASTQFGK